jgi:ssDNA-binding Zn-finger/Zn-ribbon topoisomerase 1
MTEANKVHCKKCGEMKVRVEAGKFPGVPNKRYEDEHKNLWNGRTCPQCHLLKVKEGMKKLRFVRRLSAGAGEI